VSAWNPLASTPTQTPLSHPAHSTVRIELQPRGAGAARHGQKLRLSGTLALRHPPHRSHHSSPICFTTWLPAKMAWWACGRHRFDEVADLQKMPKEVITTRKPTASQARSPAGRTHYPGSRPLPYSATRNQPVEVMVRSSHLFAPLRRRFARTWRFWTGSTSILPGWEVPKMRVEYFTDGYGFRGGLSGRSSPRVTAA